ncbi:hypothetical protein C8J57DRAFT_1469606 [Mycena rebaudengoi]|nr:hypothetical protein C8J57DRAFT_1469606 [Mycena rebaudengoi]
MVSLGEKLPQELVDEILDSLGPLDCYTARSYSLVCRSWVPQMRAQAFKEVRLKPVNIERFAVLLCADECTFSSHVSSLKVDGGSLSTGEVGIYLDIFVGILKRLTNLRTLRINLIGHVSTMEVSADDPPAEFCGVMVAKAFPLVTELHVSYMGKETSDVVDMICAFPLLQRLRTRSSYQRHLALPLSLPMPPPKLHSIDVCRSSVRPILSWLQASNHLRHIDSLLYSKKVDAADVPLVRASLQQLGTSLRHLHIMPSWYEDDVDPQEVFDLSNLKGLNSLTIHEAYEGRGAPNPKFMPFLFTLASPSLETLYIELADREEDRDWASFDAFFSKEKFPRLQNISFRSSYADGKQMPGRLPLLTGSGIVKV